MPTGTKIATCNYCGTRAALVLRGQERHELACSACGAPLHDLKLLKVEKPPKEERVRIPTYEPQYGISHRPAPKKSKPKKKKYKPRRKGLFRKVLEEAFDVVEDIFD